MHIAYEILLLGEAKEHIKPLLELLSRQPELKVTYCANIKILQKRSLKTLPRLVIITGYDVEEIISSIADVRLFMQQVPVFVFYGYNVLWEAFQLYHSGAKGILHSQEIGMLLNAVECLLQYGFYANSLLFEILQNASCCFEKNSFSLEELQNMLTPTQWKIMNLLYNEPEITNKTLSKMAYICESTIEKHLNGTFKRLNVKNRYSAVKVFARVKSRELIHETMR